MMSIVVHDPRHELYFGFPLMLKLMCAPNMSIELNLSTIAPQQVCFRLPIVAVETFSRNNIKLISLKIACKLSITSQLEINSKATGNKNKKLKTSYGGRKLSKQQNIMQSTSRWTNK